MCRARRPAYDHISHIERMALQPQAHALSAKVLFPLLFPSTISPVQRHAYTPTPHRRRNNKKRDSAGASETDKCLGVNSCFSFHSVIKCKQPSQERECMYMYTQNIYICTLTGVLPPLNKTSGGG